MDGAPSRKRKVSFAEGPATKRAKKREEEQSNEAVPPPPSDSISVTHPNIYQQLEELRQTTPRFLFRAYRAASGGSADLNTVDAITPLAFRTDPNRPPFGHLSRARLVTNIRRHVQSSRDVESYFSSWSQSLTTALQFAPHGDPTSHIAILDTHALGAQNVALYEPKLTTILDPNIHPYEREFLIYGIVSAPAFKAVARKDIPEFVKLQHAGTGLDEAVRVALESAHLFGDRFELLMIAHSLNVVPRSPATIDKMIKRIGERFHCTQGTLSVLPAENVGDIYRKDAPSSATAMDLFQKLYNVLLRSQIDSKQAEILTLHALQAQLARLTLRKSARIGQRAADR